MACSCRPWSRAAAARLKMLAECDSHGMEGEQMMIPCALKDAQERNLFCVLRLTGNGKLLRQFVAQISVWTKLPQAGVQLLCLDTPCSKYLTHGCNNDHNRVTVWSTRLGNHYWITARWVLRGAPGKFG